MKRVGSREFFRQPYKYLKELPLIVTRKGVDVFKVDAVGYEKEFYKATKVSPTVIAAKGKDMKAAKEVAGWTYSCGCKVVEKKKLCQKHGRA